MCVPMSRTSKAKTSIGWYFFLAGATLGNWAALLPFTKTEQNIGNGELGLILLAAVGGALCALPLVTSFINAQGSRVSTVGSALLMFFLFPLVGVAHNIGVFILAVTLLGFAIGCLDVSMNGQAVLCEKMTRLPTLGLFHCVYSLGSFAGAVLGGLLMELPHMTVMKQVVIFGVIFIGPTILLSAWLYSSQEEKLLGEISDQFAKLRPSSDASGATTSATPLAMHPAADLSEPLVLQNSDHGSGSDIYTDTDHSRASGDEGTALLHASGNAGKSSNSNASSSMDSTATTPSWFAAVLTSCGCSSYIKYETLFLISMIAFLSYFGEGSISDWSVIYFVDELGTSPFISTFGFAAFELSIFTGRFYSDTLSHRLGRRQLMGISGVVATCGLAVVVVTPWICSVQSQRTGAIALSVLGFAICGLGLSSLVPSAISMAGSEAVCTPAGLSAADGIGLVTSVGYLGVMLSPPFLGQMSVLLHSLRWSFAIDAGLLVPIALFVFGMRQSVFRRYQLSLSGKHDVASDDDTRTSNDNSASASASATPGTIRSNAVFQNL
jgi:MFS family permease